MGWNHEQLQDHIKAATLLGKIKNEDFLNNFGLRIFIKEFAEMWISKSLPHS